MESNKGFFRGSTFPGRFTNFVQLLQFLSKSKIFFDRWRRNMKKNGPSQLRTGLNMGTLHETNIALENRPSQKERIALQPSIFSGKFVSFREGNGPFWKSSPIGFLLSKMPWSNSSNLKGFRCFGTEIVAGGYNSLKLTVRSLKTGRNPKDLSPFQRVFF